MSDETCKACQYWNHETAECSNPTQKYETYLYYKMNLFVEFDPTHYFNYSGYNFSCVHHGMCDLDKAVRNLKLTGSHLPRDGIRREIKYPQVKRKPKPKRKLKKLPVVFENMLYKKSLVHYLYRDRWLYQWSVMLDYPDNLRIKTTS